MPTNYFNLLKAFFKFWLIYLTSFSFKAQKIIATNEGICKNTLCVISISQPRHRNIDIGMPSADVEKLFGNCYRSEEMTIGSLKLVIFHKVAIFHHFADDPK